MQRWRGSVSRPALEICIAAGIREMAAERSALPEERSADVVNCELNLLQNWRKTRYVVTNMNLKSAACIFIQPILSRCFVEPSFGGVMAAGLLDCFSSCFC